MNQPFSPLLLLPEKSHAIYSFVTSRSGLIKLQLRRTFQLLILLSGCSYLSAQASTPEINWKKGNQFYQQKEYDSAAFYFEQVASAKPADGTIFYNLGNTYYRLNNIGLAVLNYQRALKRNPGYKEASDNLLLTQTRIPGFIQPAGDIFFVRWWKAATAPHLIKTWSVFSLLLFAALIGLLLYRRLNKGRVSIRPQYIGALAVVWLLALTMAFAASQTALTDIRAVVVDDNASIPRGDKKGVIILPEGTTVRILSSKNNTCEIELPDGRTGTIRKEMLHVVD